MGLTDQTDLHVTIASALGPKTTANPESKPIRRHDGSQHSENAQQWLTDIFRREELDRMRWRLVVVTKEGIYDDPVQREAE